MIQYILINFIFIFILESVYLILLKNYNVANFLLPGLQNFNRIADERAFNDGENNFGTVN